MLLRKDEIRTDSNNLDKDQKMFEQYQKYMHSGVGSGLNANLVKKYIKLNFIEWSRP